MPPSTSEFEKLGAFYLGKPLGDPGAGPLLYDSRDLVTHAVCVGMTGSGKTGLCLALLWQPPCKIWNLSPSALSPPAAASPSNSSDSVG
jgi:hypothetical protein